MAKKKIRGNMANILTYLGSLYRNPADAIKEYISNALDEWRKARDNGEMEGPCKVSYALEKGKITIEYNSPGMDENEFEAALDRVADSAKSVLTTPQIGELGIGIFAFNQVGSKCTFYSKKAKGTSTVKVVLEKHSDEADIETATKRESLTDPGMRVVITGLQHDPTKARGPLTIGQLGRFFAEKFDSYLREGNLKIAIASAGKVHEVEPLEISLTPIGEAFKEAGISTDWQKKFRCQLWFDPSGKSRVSIRHMGVPIVEDLRAIQAYGLEESEFANGYVKGYIDADFLKPLPARTGFEENREWIQLLSELDKICPSIEAEVEELRYQEQQKRLTAIQKKAIEFAREILDQEQFKDLVLLGGLRRKRGPIVNPGVIHATGTRNGTRSKTQGTEPEGMRISYSEEDFEDGPRLHSRFVAGTVQVNRLNQDFMRERSSSEESQLAYGTLMIGKETITFNDSSGVTDDFLEKLLSYMFQVRLKTEKGSISKKTGKLSKSIKYRSLLREDQS